MAQDLIKLENVYFYYTRIAEPQLDAFDPAGLQKKFTTTICLSKAEAKEFKRLKLNKTVKEISGEEFRSKYRVDPPEEFKNEDDEYYMIGVSVKATYADGNPTPDWTHPKTYILENELPVERTSTLVGNGSSGDIRLSTRESKSGQVNVYLHSILVRNLIPFEKADRSDEWANPTQTETVGDDDLPF